MTGLGSAGSASKCKSRAGPTDCPCLCSGDVGKVFCRSSAAGVASQWEANGTGSAANQGQADCTTSGTAGAPEKEYEKKKEEKKGNRPVKSKESSLAPSALSN